MTKVIEIDRSKVRFPKELAYEADDYVRELNGISYTCQMYDEYAEGCRNTIAVNLTVSSYLLGMNAQEVLAEFIAAGLIDPKYDDESPTARINRALDYRYRFGWDWMIDPEDYLKYGDVSEDDDSIVLFFKLV